MTDRELVQIVMEFRNGILEDLPDNVSMCFAVSWPLSSYLRTAAGIESRLVRGAVGDDEEHSHHWLRLADGRIIDATADQFGGPPVYLGPLPNGYVEVGDDDDD